MTAFFQKFFHRHDDDLKVRQKKAREQDKRLREGLTERQIDKELKDTMAGSDPVSKY